MKAKCLCGKVEFEFEPTDGVAMNCYCSVCRRAHGAGYATQLMSSKSSLNFIRGKSFLTEFNSSQYGVRTFCSHCGSSLMNYAKDGVGNYMSVCLSAVTDEHNIEPSVNVQVASKADWVTLAPDIPNFDAFPDDIQKYM